MSWATRRQFLYLFIFLIFVGLVIFIFLYPVIFKKPTCNDHKKNGTETGIDCGGICPNVCQAEAIEPVVLWSRAFPVTGSFYNLVALVNNQNKNAAIANISYKFNVYDTNNKLIGSRSGSTFIAPNKQTAVFEASFDSGQATVHSVDFEFTPPYNWLKKEPKVNLLPISIDRVIWGQDVTNPTLTARLKNDSIYDISSFDVIVILYDTNKNAINASKTYKDILKSNGESSVIFTWPQKLDRASVTEDILLQINPFAVSF